jgi:hypothetical protein
VAPPNEESEFPALFRSLKLDPATLTTEQIAALSALEDRFMSHERNAIDRKDALTGIAESAVKPASRPHAVKFRMGTLTPSETCELHVHAHDAEWLDREVGETLQPAARAQRAVAWVMRLQPLDGFPDEPEQSKFRRWIEAGETFNGAPLHAEAAIVEMRGFIAVDDPNEDTFRDTSPADGDVLVVAYPNEADSGVDVANECSILRFDRPLYAFANETWGWSDPAPALSKRPSHWDGTNLAPDVPEIDWKRYPKLATMFENRPPQNVYWNELRALLLETTRGDAQAQILRDEVAVHDVIAEGEVERPKVITPADVLAAIQRGDIAIVGARVQGEKGTELKVTFRARGSETTTEVTGKVERVIGSETRPPRVEAAKLIASLTAILWEGGQMDRPTGRGLWREKLFWAMRPNSSSDETCRAKVNYMVDQASEFRERVNVTDAKGWTTFLAGMKPPPAGSELEKLLTREEQGS